MTEKLGPRTVTTTESVKSVRHYFPLTSGEADLLQAHVETVLSQWLSNVGKIARLQVYTEKGYAVDYEIEIVGEK